MDMVLLERWSICFYGANDVAICALSPWCKLSFCKESHWIWLILSYVVLWNDHRWDWFPVYGIFEIGYQTMEFRRNQPTGGFLTFRYVEPLAHFSEKARCLFSSASVKYRWNIASDVLIFNTWFPCDLWLPSSVAIYNWHTLYTSALLVSVKLHFELFWLMKNFEKRSLLGYFKIRIFNSSGTHY